MQQQRQAVQDIRVGARSRMATADSFMFFVVSRRWSENEFAEAVSL